MNDKPWDEDSRLPLAHARVLAFYLLPSGCPVEEAYDWLRREFYADAFPGLVWSDVRFICLVHACDEELLAWRVASANGGASAPPSAEC